MKIATLTSPSNGVTKQALLCDTCMRTIWRHACIHVCMYVWRLLLWCHQVMKTNVTCILMRMHSHGTALCVHICTNMHTHTHTYIYIYIEMKTTIILGNVMKTSVTEYLHRCQLHCKILVHLNLNRCVFSYAWTFQTSRSWLVQVDSKRHADAKK